MAVIVKTNGIPFWLGLVNSPPILGHIFSGDWDADWGYDLVFDPWPLVGFEANPPQVLCWPMALVSSVDFGPTAGSFASSQAAQIAETSRQSN